MRTLLAPLIVLAITACTTVAPIPEDLSGRSADELRAMRRAVQLPACAAYFVNCEERQGLESCQVVRRRYEFPMGRLHRWEECEPQFIAAQDRLREINRALREADPPRPSKCSAISPRLLEELDIAPDDPYAHVRLLLRGNFVNSQECTAQLCEWVDRNLNDGGSKELPAVCHSVEASPE